MIFPSNLLLPKAKVPFWAELSSPIRQNYLGCGFLVVRIIFSLRSPRWCYIDTSALPMHGSWKRAPLDSLISYSFYFICISLGFTKEKKAAFLRSSYFLSNITGSEFWLFLWSGFLGGCLDWERFFFMYGIFWASSLDHMFLGDFFLKFTRSRVKSFFFFFLFFFFFGVSNSFSQQLVTLMILGVFVNTVRSSSSNHIFSE